MSSLQNKGAHAVAIRLADEIRPVIERGFAKIDSMDPNRLRDGYEALSVGLVIYM